MWRVVLFCCFAELASAGSVWWEWWDSPESCEGNLTKVNVLHTEFTLDSTCISTALLQDGDPFKTMCQELYPGEALFDYKVHCCDPAVMSCKKSSEGGNVNAADDMVVVQLYNSTDESCSGQLLYEVIVNSTMCGTKVFFNVTFGPLELSDYRTRTLPFPEAPLEGNRTPYYLKAFGSTRMHCSRCEWMFLEAAAQPYVLQAAAILLFLVGCIIYNFVFEDLFNQFMKKAPPLLLPCLFPPEEKLGPRELGVGVTVIIPSAEWFLASATRRKLEDRQREAERRRRLLKERKRLKALAGERSAGVTPADGAVTPFADADLHLGLHTFRMPEVDKSFDPSGSIQRPDSEGDSASSCYSVDAEATGEWKRSASPALEWTLSRDPDNNPEVKTGKTGKSKKEQDMISLPPPEHSFRTSPTSSPRAGDVAQEKSPSPTPPPPRTSQRRPVGRGAPVRRPAGQSVWASPEPTSPELSIDILNLLEDKGSGRGRKR
eukprot:Hpha_TRINITY_DN16022_c3_g4::TRINITY_DN16022_c3_g4_i1::g.118664::m.118664